MITFTPLSGAAHSSRTVPLAYLLQVDDVRILLDCGSPDWIPEDSADNNWENYCEALRQSAHVFSSYQCTL
jgi:cleavage and polyadenylation specificity factor subunit 2